jgi:hypothetical protein
MRKLNPTTQRTARLILVAFLFTFAVSRILVYLIMSRRIPDLYAHAHGTHIHHLNYGIFLLTGVGAYLLLAQPGERVHYVMTALYGVGLALTFDEFGMWLHLNALYWQRANFDAVVTIAGLLGVIILAPKWRSFTPRHWATAVALIAVLALFGILLRDSLRYANTRLVPRFRELEEGAPK